MTIPPHRIAGELRRVAAADEGERVHRRRLARVIGGWMVGYLIGFVIIGMAFHIDDPTLEYAPTLLAIGQTVCASSTVITVFRFWKIVG